MGDWVISTNLARCRDCYRCVRMCPVKAVRVRDGQAQIVPELCIACGQCLRVCPQSAKVVRDDRELIRQAMAGGRRVVATVAPSAPAFFAMQVFRQMEEALRALGFAAAGETAVGAEMVGIAHRELVERDPSGWPLITSSCPVVVNLIERYYPDLVPHIAPVVSPMVAHGRWLKQTYGEDAFVVFIGPCIAKKAEFLRPGVQGAIDAGLTFSELREWMIAEGVTLSEGPSDPGSAPRSCPRLFPVEGGLVGTADLDTDVLTSHVVTTSGLEACEDVLRGVREGRLSACLAELMACEGGCINGPGVDEREGVFVARQRIIEFASRRQDPLLPPREEWPELACAYHDERLEQVTFSDEQVTEMLRRVDKFTPEDELNCGACGYASCREKAVATLRGMAEATMCIPYMRRRAESLRQVVMDVTPNAVLVVDKGLNIQDMSPSAERMLGVRLNKAAAIPLRGVIDALEAFAHVRDTGEPVLNRVARLREDLIVEQTIVPVEGQGLLVAILRDITERERQHEEIEHIRREALSRTQEVVKNQMRVAHEIAQLLGETTADARMALSRLAALLEKGDE